jgi:hypothetical protein
LYIHMTNTNPTAAQIIALAKLMKLRQDFQPAAVIGVSAATLGAMVRAGLVQRTWRTSSLRGGDQWGYKISRAGREAFWTLTDARRAN